MTKTTARSPRAGVHLRRVIDTTMRSTFGLVLYRRQFRPVLWVVLALYIGAVACMMWVAADTPNFCGPGIRACDAETTWGVLAKLASAYSPIFFDVAVVALIGTGFLWAYRHGFDGAVGTFRSDRLERLKDEAVVVPLAGNLEISAELTHAHFSFVPALRCTIEASPLSSEAVFQSTQGGFDLAKLTLCGVERVGSNVRLKLGTCAFRDLNYAHYWPFVPVASESTDETEQRPTCLYDLLSPSQQLFANHVRQVITGVSGPVPAAFAPNPLGVSAFLHVSCGTTSFWLMRERTRHVAADKRKYCAAVAGLIDVFPDFAGIKSATALQLIRHEYIDEVLQLIQPELRPQFEPEKLMLQPLGLTFTPESNYQPELYFLAKITLADEDAAPALSRPRGQRVVLPSLRGTTGELHEIERVVDIKNMLRERDRVALEHFVPDLNGA